MEKRYYITDGKYKKEYPTDRAARKMAKNWCKDFIENHENDVRVLLRIKRGKDKERDTVYSVLDEEKKSLYSCTVRQVREEVEI